MSKEVEIIISSNTKPFKDGLKRVRLRTAFFHLAIVIKQLREAVDNLVEELKEGKEDE